MTLPVGETDPAYGGYGAPEGDPIQGDIMLISADEAKTTEARYTVKACWAVRSFTPPGRRAVS